MRFLHSLSGCDKKKHMGLKILKSTGLSEFLLYGSTWVIWLPRVSSVQSGIHHIAVDTKPHAGTHTCWSKRVAIMQDIPRRYNFLQVFFHDKVENGVQGKIAIVMIFCIPFI